MQAIYRLNAKEISMTFLKSLKTLFEGKVVEITVKAIEDKEVRDPKVANRNLLEMIKDNMANAPIISKDVNICALIDEGHNPENI